MPSQEVYLSYFSMTALAVSKGPDKVKIEEIIENVPSEIDLTSRRADSKSSDQCIYGV